MFEVRLINFITSGIPELVEYRNEDEFRAAWREIFDECDQDENEDVIPWNFENSLNIGYLVNHKTEYRAESLYPSGVALSSFDALHLCDVLFNNREHGQTEYEYLTMPSVSLMMYNRIVTMLVQDCDSVRFSELYPRQCSISGRGIFEGWVWGEGAFYTATKSDTLHELKKSIQEPELMMALVDFTDDELLEWAHEENILYWTRWDVEVDHKALMEEYQKADGALLFESPMKPYLNGGLE